MRRFIVCAFLWVVSYMSLTTSGHCQEIAPVVLLNGTLIDGTGDVPVPGAVVVIEHDRVP